jgi:hypothetical protein
VKGRSVNTRATSPRPRLRAEKSLANARALRSLPPGSWYTRACISYFALLPRSTYAFAAIWVPLTHSSFLVVCLSCRWSASTSWARASSARAWASSSAVRRRLRPITVSHGTPTGAGTASGSACGMVHGAPPGGPRPATASTVGGTTAPGADGATGRALRASADPPQPVQLTVAGGTLAAAKGADSGGRGQPTHRQRLSRHETSRALLWSALPA